jgi:hypothetical protein
MSNPVHFSGGPGTKAFTTLNEVDDNADGVAFRTERAHSAWGIQVTTTGSPNAGTVTLQLSIDGTNFFTSGTSVDLSQDSSGVVKWASDKPAIAARATLASLGGGTDPTVTAKICAV